MFQGWTNGRSARQKGGMALTLALVAVVSPLNAADAAGVRAVSVDGTTVTVSLDGAVSSASSFILAGPDRIAIDIEGADPGGTASSGGPVSRVRQGRFDARTTRIVFDLAEPAIVSSGAFSPDGKRLTLSLSPVEPLRLAIASAEDRKLYTSPVAARAKPPRSSYSLTVPLAPARSNIPRPRIYGPAGRPLVVIDAGHGGHDPGAISPTSGVREKDVTLGVARQIRDALIASGRVRVALTREDDRFYVLRERSAIARNLKADLFISVHADAAPATTATGATVYTLSEVASDREAQLLAQRENRADVINGVDLGAENREIASILVDLAQRETMNASAGFANLLKREAARYVPFRSDFHKMAGLAVLKSPDMPSILLEVGYLTNPTDAQRVASKDGQVNIATGVRKAVEVYFARRLAQR
jgi:N-acetylmuramoyl-L-alanine amidase